ncbi:hypothetical protein TBLA_0H00160 [Henningerozyma blattae CBS 6284]|uniref:Ribosomal RNA-processing protein 40 n=1 Tax=Henningerozyma blattae (strain ATCC 34711 / CBS 6284 / DSM 70876 / NBRC 10599 / NRRL Y-10934 / UCD 77-7) TaxID=1071380 RepID=I2H7F7_HENB6|nr:hypothetical protein TBLA_0H00160 [Tetrapisispora blattae CBS 6284]CCH62309.1 hypothetical protein TBLA_0H00160 [Tetrapisispora blattae CBS 6284]
MSARIVLPGDLLSVTTNEELPVLLGPGVVEDPQTQIITPVNAGIEVVTQTRKATTINIDYDSTRYIPAVGDYVIGIITGAFGDSYKVSLASFSNGVSLSYMAFPNATKKNRPTLKVGDLVYARVCSAEKELEAEIECVDSTTGKDTGFGHLAGGMVIDVTLSFARNLLFNNDSSMLKILAKHTQFEIAIGVNGKIWVKAPDIKNTLACYKSIEECSKSKNSSEFPSIIKAIFTKLTNTIE